MRRLGLALLLDLLAVLGAGCGTPGRNVPVELAPACAPTPSRLVSAEVGRLLSADPDESRAAERRLISLDDEGRGALLAHARRIPGERDPRWLHVLEENHALPPLPVDEEVTYLLWKVSRPESFYVMKAQGRLLDRARTHPEVLLARLERGGRGVEAVAVALALAGERRAIEPLLVHYESARTPQERRVAAEALTYLVGEERRPRVHGGAAEIRREAQALRRFARVRYPPTGPPAQESRGGD